MMLKKIRLELARDREFPNGSRQHGYEFVAPLDEQGHIDAEQWREHRDRCRVRRFWQGEDDEVGHVVRRPGGSWAFHYDIHGDSDDDESGYRFASHAFQPGEYVSIKEQDEELRTFRVVSVNPV
jgi:hypothetical protein